MRRYIPGACLLVADRPQAPKRTGAFAPVLLTTAGVCASGQTLFHYARLTAGIRSIPLSLLLPTQPASLGLRGGPIMQGEKNHYRASCWRSRFFQAQNIGDFTNCERGPPEISEFPGAVQGSRVEHDMRVNMMFVNVSRHRSLWIQLRRSVIAA